MNIILVRQLYRLFDNRDRIKMLGLFLMVLIGSLFEVIGVGVFLPFMEIISKPELLLENARVGPFLQQVGIVDPKTAILATSSLMLGLFIFKAVYLATQWRLYFGFIYDKIVSLSKTLLDTYLRNPYTFHLQRNTAELIRNTNVEVINVGGVLKMCMALPCEILVSLGVLGLLVSTEPVIAIVGLLVLGLVGWGVASLTKKRLTQLGEVRVAAQGRMIQWVNQGLGGVKEIKVLGRESYFVDALERSGRKFGRAQLQSTLFALYPRLVIETTAVVGLVSLITLLLLSRGEISEVLPILALFGAAAVRLVPSISRMVSAVNTLRFYAPSVGVVHKELKDATRAVDAQLNLGVRPEIIFQKGIGIENLTYSYSNTNTPAIEEITLAIGRGQTVAFVGASGAGKTTLVNLILGLLQPSFGRIHVDGVDIQENVSGWQRQLGYIPQDIFLSDDTVCRNVAFGVPDNEIDVTVIWRALKSAQLASFVRGLEDGLETFVGERGIRMSAGQRQRIGIARALYHDPEILVLDEATSALDNETERQFAAAIDDLSKSKTLIVIAHRLSTIQHCDIIHVLDAGRLVGSGNYDELVSSNPVFQRLVWAGDSRLIELQDQVIL